MKSKGIAGFNVDSSLPSNHVGIAFDVGTTTIACALYCLSTGDEIISFGEGNEQVTFGTDVISRISFSMKDDGFDKLHGLMKMQVGRMISRAMLLCQAEFFSERRGRAELKKIVVAGNTVMESFLAGVSVRQLASAPFVPESTFGFEGYASIFFGDVVPVDCSIYFVPCVSGFIGGDIVCSMLSAGFHESAACNRFLADIGTNCEMCVIGKNTEKIICTSTAAGPAFEGYGIECGSPAVRGAIVKVSLDGECPECTVIGGGEPISISGTGLVSAISEMVKKGHINRDGSFVDETQERFCLSEKVWLSVKDIRNFQLAKGAVYSGLEMLSCNVEKSDGAVLFLAGGFGNELSVLDAVNIRMIPGDLKDKMVPLGNGSLYGASMILLDDAMRKKAEELCCRCSVLELAGNEEFSRTFISSMDF